MDKVIVIAHDEVNVKIETEPSIAHEIQDHFSFEAPNARFDRRVKAGLWDGIIKLFSPYRPYLYKGLLTELYSFCERRGYRMILEKGLAPEGSTDSESLLGWMRGITSDKFEERDYQTDAFLSAVAMDRGVFLSSTSSGKTMMIYRLARYYAELTGKPTLIMTSRTNLVAQMASDFADYSSGEMPVRTVSEDGRVGAVKDSMAVVSTWQSAKNGLVDWYENFGCVIADEVHAWDSGVFIKIMEKTRKIKFKFGFTGTLDGSKINKMTLTGLFGPVIRVSSNKERIDAGDVARPIITCIRLVYPDADKKLRSAFGTNENGKRVPMSYQQEIEHVIAHEGRRRFLVDLCSSLEGNTLVLFNRNEKFGLPVFERMVENNPTKRVSLVYGQVESDDRIQIQKTMEVSDDNIVMASLGTFSEGMSVKNIRNVVFAYPMKSSVRLLQSIGRGLRKTEGKDFCRFYDIVDDLTWKSKQNHCWKHGLIRCEIYGSEGFDYRWRDVSL